MTKPDKAKQRLQQEPDPREPDEQLKKGSQDVTSTRAKNMAHKKVTADKWNQ
jgi:hypothetical protein